MKRKTLLLMLLLAFAMPWAAMAQTTVTCYPPTQTYATGYCTSTEKTSGDMHTYSNSGVQGWMKFDVSAIPDNVIVSAIKLKFYCTSTSNSYVKLTSASRLDPVTASASDLYTAIRTESPNYYTSTYINGFSSIGWKEFNLSSSAISNLQSNGLANDYFTIGFYEYESGDYHLEASGYNSSNRPYIEVTYSSPTMYDSDGNELTWADFVSNVNGGNTYSGKTVYLNKDISISTMVGTESNPFRGTFDGQGHTLTVNIDGGNNQGAAPFRYISGATIENLKVKGTVTSKNHHAGGLVGFADNSAPCETAPVEVYNTIRNCLVETNVTNTDTGNNFIGGIIGHAKMAQNTIEGCVYAGTLSSKGCKGGMIGWSDWSKLTLTNSFFNGTNSGDGSFNPVGCKTQTYDPGNCWNDDPEVILVISINNFYYNTDGNITNFTSALYNTQYASNWDKHARTITLAASPTAGGTVSLGNITDTYSVSGITAYNKGIKYNNTFYAGSGDELSVTATANAGYSFSQWNGGSTTNPYNYTMPNSDASLTANFLNTPHAIASVEDWDAFCAAVNSGHSYSNETVTLMNDISGVTTMANHEKNFEGTFDGNNHTIEVNYTSTVKRCAPFPTVVNATFKDLTIKGTISTSHTETGGFVGYVGGSNGCSFTNCVSDVDITSSCTGSISQGGFVGQMDRGSNPTATFTGCAFTGSFSGSERWGGFVGWNEGYAWWAQGNHSTVILTNCVFAPRSITDDVDASDCATFARSTDSDNTSYVTITNCYYTQALGTAQGKQAYTVTGVSPVTVERSGSASNTYDVSGITAYNPGLNFTNNGVTIIYAGNNDNITLNLGYTGEGTVNQYTHNGIAFTDDSNPYSLTMPNENVVIAVANISFTKEIEAYGTSERGGYYLIASPVGTEVTPSADNGFLSGTYDLYYFDQNAWDIVDNESVLLEWRNYDVKHFSIASGTGYLYANKEGTTLTFTGTPYSGNGEVTLSKIEGPRFSGWNLVGNPFAQTAYFTNDFYTLNVDRNEVVAGTTKSVEAMEGIFVVAANNGETMTFSTTQLGKSNSQMSINVVRNRGNVIDRAIVRFDEESLLPKFQLNPDHTKVYIPMEGKDYAVVYADAAGTMPVNFKAETDGTYTMNFNAEEVSFNYLHLIDNMTGADVDLLATPSYSFESRTTDYASRFKLVFATGEGSDDNFAFFSNGTYVINNDGNATLQVIDLTGRVLSSETISGSCSKAINVAPGVYMLRLVNGNSVKVQKIVVR